MRPCPHAWQPPLSLSTGPPLRKGGREMGAGGDGGNVPDAGNKTWTCGNIRKQGAW